MHLFRYYIALFQKNESEQEYIETPSLRKPLDPKLILKRCYFFRPLLKPKSLGLACVTSELVEGVCLHVEGDNSVLKKWMDWAILAF